MTEWVLNELFYWIPTILKLLFWSALGFVAGILYKRSKRSKK